MPLQETSGAASFDAFGGGAAAVPVYIEDIFSCFLYTGTSATQTITNGIDLSGKGGLVWIKCRTTALDHFLFDTSRGVNNYISSNRTGAQNWTGSYSNLMTAFNTTGFTLGNDSGDIGTNNAVSGNFASWTFRKQAKFFDVVTYTGNGANNRQISHNLGSAPGCIILKRTDGTGDWWTYHRSLGDLNGFSYDLQLNTTSNRTAYQIFGTGATQTSTYFTLGTVFANEMNGNGATYVAYLFAHNAGGFGLAGTDNVISCGSYSGSGSANQLINLGYEPQWLLLKKSDASSNWFLFDSMRPWATNSSLEVLYPNLSSASYIDGQNYINIQPNGFSTGTDPYYQSGTFIYIAIRRGPMKTPTTGTSVFLPYTGNGQAGGVEMNTGFDADAVLSLTLNAAAANEIGARFTYAGSTGYSSSFLRTDSTAAEVVSSVYFVKYDNKSKTIKDERYFRLNTGGNVDYIFGRAPGFFDVVCYAGNGIAGRTINHNLTVVPEMMIVKPRNDPYSVPSENFWTVYHAALGNTQRLRLNSDIAPQTTSTGAWNNTTPTASVFSVGNSRNVNFDSATNYVAYLFATVAGVSKVGTYTGTGTTQTINCGFTAGSRFVMIKRTDATGDWFVWDSARGIVAGNDPYSRINVTAAEVTGTDYIDTAATGFEISSTAPAAINANGGTFIFLAIA